MVQPGQARSSKGVRQSTSMGGAGNSTRRVRRESTRGRQPRMSKISGKGSTKTGGEPGGSNQIQVFDEQGNDVTPKPMLSLKPTHDGAAEQTAATPVVGVVVQALTLALESTARFSKFDCEKDLTVLFNLNPCFF